MGRSWGNDEDEDLDRELAAAAQAGSGTQAPGATPRSAPTGVLIITVCLLVAAVAVFIAGFGAAP